MPANDMKDLGAERAILSLIMVNGRDAFIEAESYLSNNDFSSDITRTIYTSFKELSNDGVEEFNPEIVRLKIKALKKDKMLENKDVLTYINNLMKCTASTKNIKDFCVTIKKFSIVRELHKRHTSMVADLENLDGSETINDIITKTEETITTFINGADISSEIHSLTESIDSYIQEIMDSEIVDQIGLPTGFPIWDDLIGGGIRGGTVNFIVARPKVGKSWDALNKARNLAKIGIPTLYLDSELTEDYQKSRLLSIDSGCPISPLETGKFKTNKDYVRMVVESSKKIKTYPIFYQSIAGMSPTEVCSIIRRWIIKKVGFNDKGKANNCAVVYDYLKLTSGNDLTKTSPEYLLLGLMMTDLSNLAIRYNIPIVCYGQCNREGIDGEETSVVAGSDRILWLCSNLSILKNKTPEDETLGCGFDHGNKKLVILETRQGSGHTVGADYINLHASLRPGIEKENATGLIKEGLLYSQIRNPTGAI